MASLPSALPQPQIIDPHSVPSLRWGVLGPGHIADVFVRSVHKHTAQRVIAAGSRSLERARTFAENHSLARWYANYDDLLGDPEIDVIYVSTRQHVHKDGVLSALEAGKHVLVEKPLATLPADAREIRDAARRSGQMVMEALWTTYLPQSSIVRQLIDDGVLGEIGYVRADLGELKAASDWLFTPAGGGTSHDMGIYPLAFATSVLRQAPNSVNAIGQTNEHGIDVELEMHLTYSTGARAQAFSSMLNFTPTMAWVDGHDASLLVHTPFPIPTTLTLFDRSFNPRPVASWTDTTSIQGHEGLAYQATTFAYFVGQGLIESPWRNLDTSVMDIETIATARHSIGAYYSGERRP